MLLNILAICLYSHNQKGSVAMSKSTTSWCQGVLLLFLFSSFSLTEILKLAQKMKPMPLCWFSQGDLELADPGGYFLADL